MIPGSTRELERERAGASWLAEGLAAMRSGASSRVAGNYAYYRLGFASFKRAELERERERLEAPQGWRQSIGRTNYYRALSAELHEREALELARRREALERAGSAGALKFWRELAPNGRETDSREER